MSSYLLALQKAIHDTAEQESVDVAPKLPIGPTRSYWIGWELLQADLEYAMSLGETCCRGHLGLWTESTVADDEESGYYARVVQIKQLMENNDE